MANTATLIAPSQNYLLQTTFGNVYSTTNGVISNVPFGPDVADLVKGNCSLVPSAELAPVLPWVSGRFYGVALDETPTALLTVASTLYAYPIYVPQTTTVKTLNLSVTTGQTAGAGYVGIYQDNAGYPGALVYGSAQQTGLTTTAITTITPTAGSVVLTPGWYWVASTFYASGTYISVAGSGVAYTAAVSAQLGSDTAAHALATSAEAASGISATFTYAALPATFPTGAALIQNAGVPLVAIGV